MVSTYFYLYRDTQTLHKYHKYKNLRYYLHKSTIPLFPLPLLVLTKHSPTPNQPSCITENRDNSVLRTLVVLGCLSLLSFYCCGSSFPFVMTKNLLKDLAIFAFLALALVIEPCACEVTEALQTVFTGTKIRKKQHDCSHLAK